MSYFRVVQDEEEVKQPAVSFQPTNLTPLCLSGKPLMVFWYDIHEDNYRFPGSLFLFGKLNAEYNFQSVCVKVHNIERNLFVLPKANATMPDVYEEIKDMLRTKFNVDKFRLKPVQRKLCCTENIQDPKLAAVVLDSETGIVKTATYLKIVFDFKYKAPPQDMQGKTFHAIYETTSTAKQLFIVKRKLQGPCWIQIDTTTMHTTEVPNDDKQTWCKREMQVTRQKCIQAAACQQPPPTLKVLAFSLCSIPNNQIVCLSMVKHEAVFLEHATQNQDNVEHVTLCCTSTTTTTTPQTTRKCGNEHELLSLFVTQLHLWDIDVLVSHQLHTTMVDVLVQRMAACNISQWSKLGRLRSHVRLSEHVKWAEQHRKPMIDANVAVGRLLCDTMQTAQEFLNDQTSFTLNHLAKSQLHIERNVLITSMLANQATIERQFHQDANALVAGNLQTAVITLKLMFHMETLPLTFTLTKLAGNVWNGSLRSHAAQRNDFMLMHKFKQAKFVLPPIVRDRPEKPYEGGHVIEPKVGFHEVPVLLLDFVSLYPSVILEFNLCLSTTNWKNADDDNDDYAPNCDKGILPTILKYLLDSRKTVKNQMQQSTITQVERSRLDVKQRALKLVANTGYGCHGYLKSRFYSHALVSRIPRYGRHVLLQSVQTIEDEGYEVIYGDTDSMFVKPGVTSVAELCEAATKIKTIVNKNRRAICLELDGCFVRFLLYKKKKYAALSMTLDLKCNEQKYAKVVKGLDLVRRNSAQVVKNVSEFILAQLLNLEFDAQKALDAIFPYLVQLRTAIDNHELPMEQFIIRTCLTKPIHLYNSQTQVVHVKVAKELVQEQGIDVRKGDIIEYIICQDPFATSVTAKAQSLFKTKHQNLRSDNRYYIEQQIFPAVCKLLAIFKNTTADIAKHLNVAYSAPTNADIEMKLDDDVITCVAKKQKLAIEAKIPSLKLPPSAYTTHLATFLCGVCHRPYNVGATAISNLAAYDSQKYEEKASETIVLDCGFLCPFPLCRQSNDDVKKQGMQIQNSLSLIFRDLTKKLYSASIVCSNKKQCIEQSNVEGTKCAVCKVGVFKRTFTSAQHHQAASAYLQLFDIDANERQLESINLRREAELQKNNSYRDNNSLQFRPSNLSFETFCVLPTLDVTNIAKNGLLQSPFSDSFSAVRDVAQNCFEQVHVYLEKFEHHFLDLKTIFNF